MCAPLAVALPLVAGAMQAAGAVTGGMTANSQAKYEAKAAQQNAAIATQNARDSIEMGADERKKLFREGSRQKGDQIAAMAANGIDVSEGIGARTQEDSSYLLREDAANLYRNIDARTKGSLIDASNYAAEARAAKSRGKAAMVGGLIQGASSLVSGFQQFGAAKASLGSSFKGR